MYHTGIKPEKLSFYGSFHSVVDEKKFLDPSAPNVDDSQRGYKHFIFEARCIIDQLDPNICDFMRNFNLCATPNDNVELSDKVIERLDGTPEEFLMSLVRHIDFSDTSPEVIDRNIQTLAGFVAQRFVAISLVAHGKKLNGEKTSFHPVRHEDVLNNRATSMARKYSDIPMCKEVFGEFMNTGCEIQDSYINSQEGQSRIANKLSQIGITPR